MNTQELLVLAFQRSGTQSWRKLAGLLGVTPTNIQSIRHGRSKPSDELCFEIAQMAGVDPYTALMQLNAERSEGKARRLYEKAARTAQTPSIAAE